MTNDPPPHDMSKVWQNQSVEVVQMSLDEIRRKAHKFENRISRRNRREYIAVAVVIAVCTGRIVISNNLVVNIGGGLLIAGLLYIVYQIHKKGSARTIPSDAAFANGIAFYRSELERQRDLNRQVWSWYIGPLLPVWWLPTWGLAAANEYSVRSLMVRGTVVILVFVVVGVLNQRAARKLQRQIDALDALEKESRCYETSSL